MRITAVIPTYERPEALERAVRSALDQTLTPFEVLICDDGSRPEAAERNRALEAIDPTVRYIALEANTGTPAVARNRGIREAAGDWVAFLDDDDRWTPDKLRRQAEVATEADVVGSNGMLASGTPYFADAPESRIVPRREILRHNPLIVSSVMARRELLRSSGGFPTERWAAGVADYATWLELADRGARFVVLGEPLVIYEDASADRFSAPGGRGRQERAVARVAARRVRQQPLELAQWSTLGRKLVAAVHLTVADAAATRAWRR